MTLDSSGPNAFKGFYTSDRPESRSQGQRILINQQQLEEALIPQKDEVQE